jgi:hypothetical protein
MNSEQQELVDLAYKNYVYNPDYKAEGVADLMGSQAGQLVKCPTQEDFITECKTDSKFSEKWGLKIEEHELSLEERNNSLGPNEAYLSFFGINVKDDLESKKIFDKESRPTKLITITYNNKTLESYE